MAQVGGILMLDAKTSTEGKLIFFTGINKAKFRKPVEPGDQIIFEMEILKRRQNMYIMAGKGFVSNDLVVEAEAWRPTLSGKRQPLDLKFSFVYAEEATGPFKVIYDRVVAGSGLYMRWAPKGSTTGNYQYTSDLGVVTSFEFPKGDPDKGEPVMAGFTLKTPQATQSAVA
jgi:hypothetical protein